MAVFKNHDGTSWTVKLRYTTWNGERRQKKKEGFQTKREAQEWEADFLNKCCGDVGITFRNLVDRYMEDCRTRLAPTTWENKRFLIESKLIPYFGKMPLNTITISTVRSWQNTLLSDPAGYSPTYLKTIHNQLSAIMNFGVKYYGLSRNPAALCGSMGKKNAERMQFWTADEFNQFIAAVDDPTAKAIFTLFFYSGMREGELLAQTLGDFDFEKNTVSINKSFAVVKGETIIKEPKTPKSKRIVTIPAEVSGIIREYADNLYGLQENDRLFDVSKHQLSRWMSKYAEKAGVKRIRIHDLRHSHASMLIELGVPPLAVSERLGHENIQTTLNVYSHLYPNKQGEIATLLSSQIKKEE